MLSGFQKGFKRFPILREHPDEFYPVSHLGIAGNDSGRDQNVVSMESCKSKLLPIGMGKIVSM